MKVEICVDSVEGAMAAERGGADRVELCDNLLEGGTTPSAGAIKLARSRTSLGLHVIIRPRGADFHYSDVELDVMHEDVLVAKALGANGVVIGILMPKGDVDIPRVAVLMQAARPLSVTFHRAFDMCRDPVQALEDLIGLGVDRLLTSGQEATAFEGMELIAQLQRQAAGRILIMPGGGITPRNVGRIVSGTGVSEVHLSARSQVESAMEFRNTRVSMGGALRPPEFGWKATHEGTVRRVLEELRSG